jgi:hypothetical protein
MGATPVDADDGNEVPTAFVAVTINVYGVPLVNPVYVTVVVRDVLTILPGVEVIV